MKAFTQGVSHVALGLLLAVALVGTAPPALAGTHTRTVTYAGSIILGHADWPPVTMFGAPCDPKSRLNGIDGVWYRIPRGSTYVTMSPSGTLDADLYFYSFAPGASSTVVSAQNNEWIGGKCRDAGNIFQGIYAAEGPVPAGASFVLVNGWIGTGPFSLEFDGVR